MRKTKDKASGGKHGLLYGVAVLTVAGIVVKLLGFLYKVPLNAILGDEMANVNAAYAVYAVLYVVSTAGIPSAVALAVSRARAVGDTGRIRAIFGVTFGTLAAVGAVMTVLLFALARPLSIWNSQGDSYLCMLAIAPALFFAAVASVLRGFFQGFQNMTPTAVSEMLEALGKTVFGVVLALVSLRVFSHAPRTAAAFSVLGITLGGALGAVYLFVTFLRSQKDLPPKREASPPAARGLLREMLSVALPIALTSAMMNLSTLADAQLMRPLLTTFYGDGELAKAIYADYSTGAVTLFNMPSIFIYPIAAAIVPYISTAFSRGERGAAVKTVETALSASAAISLPCALGLSALSSPLLALVFRSDTDMAEHAGGLLSVLAVSVFFSALLTVGNAALQAAGEERLPIVAVGVGLVVKVLSLLLLGRLFGAIAAPVSTLLFYTVVSGMILRFAVDRVGMRPRVLLRLLRPLPPALLCALAALGVYGGLSRLAPSAVATLSAVAVSVLVYFASALWTGVIGEEEVRLLPFGKHLLRFLPRRGAGKLRKQG